MRYFVRMACFICCVGFHVSAQQTNATSVSPWAIKEVSTFHTMLHRISNQYDEKENRRVLVNVSGELETAFKELQHASLPEKYAAAYAVFVDSIRVALDKYRKARETGNSAKLKAAFEGIDETFELAVPRLRWMLNRN